MRSGIGLPLEGQDVTEAVEERKRKRGSFCFCVARGDVLWCDEETRERERRWERPAIWSFSKERRRAVKLTAQAA